jgi:hypothetical protein
MAGHEEEGGGFLDGLFANKDDFTGMKPTIINCKQFRWHSCPKEIQRLLNEAFNLSIRNASLPRNFLDEATLSDFAAKNRDNAFKQSFLVFIVSIFLGSMFSYSVIGYIGNGYQPDYGLNLLLSFAGTFGFFNYIYFQFYWYGTVDAMKIDIPTERIVKSSVPWFKGSFYGLFGLKLMILFYLSMYASNIQSFAHWHIERMELYPQTYDVTYGFFGGTIEGATKWWSTISSMSYDGLQVMFFVFIVFMGIFVPLIGEIGFKNGYKNKIIDITEEKADGKLSEGYNIERATRILEAEDEK